MFYVTYYAVEVPEKFWAIASHTRDLLFTPRGIERFPVAATLMIMDCAALPRQVFVLIMYELTYLH